MNVAEHIAKTLADRGVTHCFAVAGGHSTFLLDALTREPRIATTFVHHECAAAMAADGYARVAGKPAVVCVSAGPAALNALNGVWGAYVDSVPMVVLSGAPPRKTTLAYCNDEGFDGRQLGDQECPITGGVLGRMTERARTLSTPLDCQYEAKMTHDRTMSGRPGPCWLEVPIDVQTVDVTEPNQSWEDIRLTAPVKECQQVLDRLRRSERPVILVGSGVRAAGALPQFRELVRRLGVPVVTAWACDAILSDDPHFCGRQGTIGDVGGNRAVQEADFLLVLGSRLCIRQVSYNWQSFAPKAFKAWVDVDPAELAKPTVKPDLPVCCDLRVFLDEMLRHWDDYPKRTWNDWRNGCRQRWLDNPVVQPRHREWTGRINPYHFLDVLWSKLADDDVVVCGNATATIMTMQVARIRGEQRLLSNSGAASMGWCLPAAIGAAVVRGGKRIICVTGDGSIMQNVQELATIAHNRLPVKVFVLNNGGYGTIKASQQRLLGREIGAGPESGVGFPDWSFLARSFGDWLTYQRINHRDFDNDVAATLRYSKSALCEVVIDPDQPQEPRLRSRRLPDGSLATADWSEFS